MNKYEGEKEYNDFKSNKKDTYTFLFVRIWKTMILEI